MDESTFHYEELFSQNEWTTAIKVKHGESTLSKIHLATISKAVISHLSKTFNFSSQGKDSSMGGMLESIKTLSPLWQNLVAKRVAIAIMIDVTTTNILIKVPIGTIFLQLVSLFQSYIIVLKKSPFLICGVPYISLGIILLYVTTLVVVMMH